MQAGVTDDGLWRRVLAAVAEATPMAALLDGARPVWQAADRLEVRGVPPFLLAEGSQEAAALARGLTAALKAVVGRSVAVTFTPLGADDAAAVAERQAAEDTERLRRVRQAEVPSGGAGAVLLGRPPKGEVLPMDRLPESAPSLVVEGVVFRRELRQGRGQEALLLWLTDARSSVLVRVNARPGRPLPIAPEDVPPGSRLRVRGTWEPDRSGDTVLTARDVERRPEQVREETVPGRVELHLHTRMSALDSVVDVAAAFARAARWGMPAVAITDHGVVQAFPEAAQQAGPVRPLYGLEAHVADDLRPPVVCPRSGRCRDLAYVVVDLETTGLVPGRDALLEIGAVRLDAGGQSTFSTFVRPPGPIPPEVQRLTGITDAMVRHGAEPEQALADFWRFADGAAVVAHNAAFDVAFLRAGGGAPAHLPVVDTLALARILLPDLKNHRLDTVCKELAVPLEHHHRALADATATAEVLKALLGRAEAMGAEREDQVAALREPPTASRLVAMTLIARDPTGLKNLYALVSESHLRHFRRVPRVPRSRLEALRQGLFVGAPIVRGEVVEAILAGEAEEELVRRAQRYDYLEVLEPSLLTRALAASGVQDAAEGRRLVERIVALGERAGRPVVAVSDAHLIDPEDGRFRGVLHSGAKDDEGLQGAYLRTAGELLEAFAFMGEATARRLVLEAPAAIAQGVAPFAPLPDGTSSPVLDDAERRVEQGARQRAAELFGDPLPEVVARRLERELEAIIGHGFASIYLSASLLVRKSHADGYMVGSRGSVGSSLVAHLLDITEVNPLPPHYRCPACKKSRFAPDLAGSGYDLPPANCACGTPLVTDGQDIPFETFLGFEGDKVPDIDLNFPGEYQPVIHRYAEEVFGAGNVFRAGTISTVAERTAYGLVKGHLRETGQTVRAAEMDRLAMGITGVKRTTGQHPGGLMIIPRGRDVHEFTPLQHPADDPGSQVVTTHFDYHAIAGRLLKLDLLGHHDPTTLRLLETYTGVPARAVPLTDPQAISLFSSTRALGVTPEQIGSETGTLGLPEFGTRFVRAMLQETKPATFADLVRVSGLSHGTDVWANNAQDLVRQKVADLGEVIATRDDVMTFLLRRGMEPRAAFTIAERVRKGQGLRPEDERLMRQVGVPEWYIGSCQKISYLFPKAHAVAYVTMACRIAYFKVHHPAAFYAAYFTIRAEEFDAAQWRQGPEAVQARMREVEAQGMEATAKDRASLTLLEVVREFYCRGLRLRPIDLYRSAEDRFLLTEEGLLPPLVSLQGLGRNGAAQLGRARAEGPFRSVEDLRVRAKLARPVVDLLAQEGCLDGLPATSQLTLF